MKVFNSMTRKKEEFVPITPGEVKMYCCGPTVYNFIHVGNARPIIIFDVLRRYFEYRGYKVTFAQNFSPMGQAYQLSRNSVGTLSASPAPPGVLAAFVLGFTAVATGTGLLVFRRKDLK